MEEGFRIPDSLVIQSTYEPINQLLPAAGGGLSRDCVLRLRRLLPLALAVEPLDETGPFLFGQMHGPVGCPDKLPGIAGRGDLLLFKGAHPDADRKRDFLFPARESMRLEAAPDALGRRLGCLLPGGAQ